MAKYRCKNCGFKMDKVSAPQKCPYCDSKSIEREESAEELLEDA